MTCFRCIAASKGAGERARPCSLKHAIRQAAKEFVTDVLRAPWWLLLSLQKWLSMFQRFRFQIRCWTTSFDAGDDFHRSVCYVLLCSLISLSVICKYGGQKLLGNPISLSKVGRRWTLCPSRGCLLHRDAFFPRRYRCKGTGATSCHS